MKPHLLYRSLNLHLLPIPLLVLLDNCPSNSLGPSLLNQNIHTLACQRRALKVAIRAHAACVPHSLRFVSSERVRVKNSIHLVDRHSTSETQPASSASVPYQAPHHRASHHGGLFSCPQDEEVVRQ